jgi:hypothetical protein
VVHPTFVLSKKEHQSKNRLLVKILCFVGRMKKIYPLIGFCKFLKTLLWIRIGNFDPDPDSGKPYQSGSGSTTLLKIETGSGKILKYLFLQKKKSLIIDPGWRDRAQRSGVRLLLLFWNIDSLSVCVQRLPKHVLLLLDNP